MIMSYRKSPHCTAIWWPHTKMERCPRRLKFGIHKSWWPTLRRYGEKCVKNNTWQKAHKQTRRRRISQQIMRCILPLRFNMPLHACWFQGECEIFVSFFVSPKRNKSLLLWETNCSEKWMVNNFLTPEYATQVLIWMECSPGGRCSLGNKVTQLWNQHSFHFSCRRTTHSYLLTEMALPGKIAVVSGAAMGIGKGMVEILLQNGAKVKRLIGYDLYF